MGFLFNAFIFFLTIHGTYGNSELKFEEAITLAKSVMNYIILMYTKCLKSAMPNQQFISDDLQSFVNFPSRTTVGYAPKFTNNRRFFANMITTSAFKEMLAKDEEELRRNIVKKLKFCDQSIMDQNILNDFYDREIDPSRM